jgi:SH3-like domain-containing protein
MKARTLFPGLVLVLAMLACNLPANIPATETPTLEALPSPTVTQPLPTDIPTQTPLPTNTPPPTLTSTPTVPVASPKEANVNCRVGPGTAWVPISALVVGQSSQITGKSSDGAWWNIVDPQNSGRRCWVSASVVNTAGNLAAILVIDTPKASVTNVTVDVDPKTISVAGCIGPILPIKIKGTIETNGPTTVKWHFETQKDGAMTNQSTDFDQFGSKDFSVDYTPPVLSGTYWVRLIVTSPNDMQAETNYKIDC